jgi:very-short-patch-repair endonuclease
LRNKQLLGYDFHRQKPLLNYIVDFYSSQLGLVIEIDGNSHNRSVVEAKDSEKENALKAYDLTILRFTERQVRFQIDDVMRVLEDYILRFKAG